MTFTDAFVISVFPEFLPIAKFYITETPHIVVLQCCKIKVLVFQKIVINRAGSTVAVTDDHIAASLLKRQSFCMIICLFQPRLTTHRKPAFLIFSGRLGGYEAFCGNISAAGNKGTTYGLRLSGMVWSQTGIICSLPSLKIVSKSGTVFESSDSVP